MHTASGSVSFRKCSVICVAKLPCGAQRSARAHQHAGPGFLRARPQCAAQDARRKPMRCHARTTETPGHVSGVKPMGTLPKPVSEVTNVGGARCATLTCSAHSKHSSASVCLQPRPSAAAGIARGSRRTSFALTQQRWAAASRRRTDRCLAARARWSVGLRSASGLESPMPLVGTVALHSRPLSSHAPGLAQRAGCTPGSPPPKRKRLAAAELGARQARKAPRPMRY